MPPDHGCRLNEYQGVEELRPQSVNPHPEQTVGQEEPKAARASTPQDDHLMSQGEEFEFQ
jgi:hypothetical protein